LKHTGHFNFCHENDTAIRAEYEKTPSTVSIVKNADEKKEIIADTKETKATTIASSKKKTSKKK
jgi:hypothetical protein